MNAIVNKGQPLWFLVNNNNPRTIIDHRGHPDGPGIPVPDMLPQWYYRDHEGQIRCRCFWIPAAEHNNGRMIAKYRKANNAW